MNSKTFTLHLPGYFDAAHEVERAPLCMLRAALVVGEILVARRSRFHAHGAMREAALLLRNKINEMLCILDVYELRLDDAVKQSADEDDAPF